MAKHTPIAHILTILQIAEGHENVSEMCRQYNVQERTFYRWRDKYGNLLAPDSTLGYVTQQRLTEDLPPHQEGSNGEQTQLCALKREITDLKELVTTLCLEINRLQNEVSSLKDSS